MAEDPAWRVVCDDYATKYMFSKERAEELAKEWDSEGAYCSNKHRIERRPRPGPKGGSRESD